MMFSFNHLQLIMGLLTVHAVCPAQENKTAIGLPLDKQATTETKNLLRNLHRLPKKKAAAQKRYQ
jgi:hypothetical protein